MTQQKQFYQKIILILLIVVLLVPIYILGSPAQRKSGGAMTDGGTLAKSRAQAGLAEANFGKIDPTGSAMKLATFGMRGVAISLLWHRSQEYEKRADWDNVVATANQIITLEPHFITIWDFVGWQLAYNASAMFDDYRERYRWVIRGFEFVQDGTVYNRNAPKLYVRTGWTISQKVGIADEKKQYRRLFREDDELAERQATREIHVSNRDNWLLGHAFYKRAEALYEDGGDIGNETRLLFYGRAPLNRIRYGEWMSIDGCGLTKDNTPLFNERSEEAWKLAEDEWKQYSNRVVVTTIPDDKEEGAYRKTSLSTMHEVSKQIEEYENQLVSFLPEGVTKDSIIWDRWNNELDDRQRASLYESILEPFDENNYNLGKNAYPNRVVRSYLDGERGEQPEWQDWKTKLYNLRTSYIDEDLRAVAQIPTLILSADEEKTYSGAYERLNDWQGRAQTLLNATPEVIADAVTPDKSAEAKDIVAEIHKLQREESFSRMFRDIMGADFHEVEVSFEQTPEARSAREHRQNVRDRYYAAQFEEANNEFLKSFDSWVDLLHREDFPKLKYMPQMQSELMDELEKYVIVLEQLETVFPKEYSFQEVVRRDQMVETRLKGMKESKEYIEKEIAEGKYKEAREHAEMLMLGWRNFNEDNEAFELGPLPETVDGVFDSVRLWVQAWEATPSSELEIAKQSGAFLNYPCKVFIEFMIQKRDDNYRQIEELEVQRMNEPEKNLENLEKEAALWAKIVESAPVLKYDVESEITGQIQNLIQEYLMELQKQNKPTPEDFPLKDFLNANPGA